MKHDQVSETEHHIEHDLQRHPHNLQHVFKELDHLRKHDQAHFNRDLAKINEHLHKKGYLPHLQITHDTDGYTVINDSSPNPKHAAVVARSHHAHESRQEQAQYKHMHYDGWKDSTMGATPPGEINDRAVRGQVPQGSRKELVDEALKLAGVAATPANEAAVNLIIQHESGWNPNAINRTDSNARSGHPSEGLMQTIPSTFHKYALRGYDSNINDPLSNVIAGVRYATHRYGSLQNVPGVKSVEHGGKYVGY